MELHQLRYFVCVAELGNFTRAAEKCFVAQPSLSQQIIKLEKELGSPLFDRSSRQVRLTDAGRILYERAVAILAAVDDVKQRMSEASETGRVAVGAIPTVAPYLLPPLLKQFARRAPRAEVAVYENLTDYTIRSCLEGEIDLGLLALPVREDQLKVEPLFREELLLAVAADHRLAQKRQVALEEVADEPFVLLSEAHCLGEQIVSFCKQRTCLPAIRCHSAQLLTVQEMVALGQGVSLVPRMAVDADKSRRRKYLPLKGERPTRTLGVIWRKHRPLSPLAEEFLAVVREFAAAQPA